jgi:hypothetical protein
MLYNACRVLTCIIRVTGSRRTNEALTGIGNMEQNARHDSKASDMRKSRSLR